VPLAGSSASGSRHDGAQPPLRGISHFRALARRDFGQRTRVGVFGALVVGLAICAASCILDATGVTGGTVDAQADSGDAAIDPTCPGCDAARSPDADDGSVRATILCGKSRCIVGSQVCCFDASTGSGCVAPTDCFAAAYTCDDPTDCAAL